MKLLNWNVNNSGEDRIRQQMKVIDGNDADIVTLTEVNCIHLEFWQRQLRQNGYKTVIPQESDDTERGTLIASRLEVARLPRLFRHPLPQCSVSAKVKINRRLVEIHCVYARADGGTKKPISQRVKKDILKSVACGVRRRSHPQIIAGDFNSPQKEIDGQIITYAQTFSEKQGWHVKGGKNADFWQSKHEAELAIFNPREDMVDAYRNCSKPGCIDHSWTKRDSQKSLRLDHIIASRSIMPTHVRYTVDSKQLPNESIPSDHAPMVAEWQQSQ